MIVEYGQPPMWQTSWGVGCWHPEIWHIGMLSMTQNHMSHRIIYSKVDLAGTVASRACPYQQEFLSLGYGLALQGHSSTNTKFKLLKSY